MNTRSTCVRTYIHTRVRQCVPTATSRECVSRGSSLLCSLPPCCLTPSLPSFLYLSAPPALLACLASLRSSSSSRLLSPLLSSLSVPPSLSLYLSLPFRLLPSRFSSLRSFVLLSFFSFPSSLFFRFPSLSALLSSPIASLSLCPKTIGQLYDHRMHDETAVVDIVSSPVLFVVATAAAVVVVVIVVVNSVALVFAEVPTPRFRRPRRG